MMSEEGGWVRTLRVTEAVRLGVFSFLSRFEEEKTEAKRLMVKEEGREKVVKTGSLHSASVVDRVVCGR